MANPYYIPRGPRITLADRVFHGLQQGLTLRQMMMKIDEMSQAQKERDAVLAAANRAYPLEGRPEVSMAPGYTLEEGGPGFAQAPMAPQVSPEQTAQIAQQATQTTQRPLSLRDLAERSAVIAQNPAALIALTAQDQKQADPRVVTDPNAGTFVVGPNGQVHFPPAAAQDRPMNVGAGGAVFDPRSREVLFQNQAQQRTPADIVNRTYAQVLSETGDPGAAEDAAAAVKKRLAAAGAIGSETGKTEVRATPNFQKTESDVAKARATGRTEGSPLEAGTQEKVSALLTAKQQIESIESNFREDFLGPIKGTEAAFAVRRRIGSYIASPLGEQEVTFRQSLADVKDQLLRARSGAQINETEYKRLAGLLPAASDEPTAFKAGLKRFKIELLTTLENRIKLGTTPRSQLEQQPASAPAPAAKDKEFTIDVKSGAENSKERKTIMGPDGKPYNVPRSATQDELKRVRDAMKAGGGPARPDPLGIR